MYNIFPKEIWILIILELPYKHIYDLYDVSDQFKDLYITENITERRKNKGFPRKSGCCEYYDVSSYSGYIYENELIYEGNFHQLLAKTGHDSNKILKYIFDAALDKLYGNNIYPIKGDLVDFGGSKIGVEYITMKGGEIKRDHNEMIFIFDGEKIVNIYHNNKVILSHDFDLINCNIPSNYWYIPIDRWYNYIPFDGAVFNFNHSFVRDQLIKNVHVGKINGILYFSDLNKLTENIKIEEINNIISTWFTLNHKLYAIIFSNRLVTKDNFNNLLLMNKSLLLKINLEKNLQNFSFEINNKIVENVFNLTY